MNRKAFGTFVIPLLLGAWAALCPDLLANDGVRMQFLTNSSGSTLVRYGDGPAFGMSEASQKSVTISKLEGGLVKISPTEPLTVSSVEFPGLAINISPHQSAIASFDYAQSVFKLTIPDGNREPTQLQLGDGARVTMNANSSARLEQMTDGSYALFGSGSIIATNADGMPVRFGPAFPPLFGGKLISPNPSVPNARFSRSSPVSQISFLGQIESDLRIQVGDKIVRLEPGKPQEATAANGGRVRLLNNPTTRTVDWAVDRGVFRFTVEAVNCWKSLGVSGQSASMQWDAKGAIIEIKNKSAAGAFQPTLLVNLSPNLNVAVGESASFQYGRTSDCSSFMASAHGGETILYNSQTDQSTRLDQGNTQIVLGSPEASPGVLSAIPGSPIQLSWNSDDRVDLKSGDTSLVVGLGIASSLKARPDEELAVVYTSKERLSLNADAGAFAVTPDFLNTLTIEMPQGARVILGLDREPGIFRLEAVTDIGLRTANGNYPRIAAGTKLTFLIGRGSSGRDIFNEAAGANLSIRPISGDAVNLNQPRVDQPPLTTLE